ncbi:MAG: hypothetical protein JNN29_02085 [Chitinophagaceae bacterium]|nr:hypothetical protein [Chitinophagaceae bacterium]MBN8667687.1 hypothetical protein [Chitinophagales bacterium]
MKTNGTRVTLLGGVFILLPCLLLLTASVERHDSAQQDLKHFPELNQSGEIWCATDHSSEGIVVIRDSKS